MADEFGADKFDAKQWVNKMTHSEPGDDKLSDQQLSKLIVNLQIAAAEVNVSIDSATSRALTSIPRSVREIERIRKEAALRNKKLATYGTSVVSAEATTDGFMVRRRFVSAASARS